MDCLLVRLLDSGTASELLDLQYGVGVKADRDHTKSTKQRFYHFGRLQADVDANHQETKYYLLSDKIETEIRGNLGHK